MPRREYSEEAILARQGLLDKAYQILAAPDKRTEYDAKFLETSIIERTEVAATSLGGNKEELETKELEIYTPSILINNDVFAGAMLFLQELGEYEMVLRQGYTYLKNFPSIYLEPDEKQLQQRKDIILTIALAYLELGREEWQQNQYENAAVSGEKGLELLIYEGLYLSVQEEIEIDLYKLRPYRILELLSEDDEAQRKKGFVLLFDMLDRRKGIDGNGDDGSGLNIDDFLRFIQQLRNYLTVREQQELFAAEAERPSAVATYLGVYAFLALGFAEKQPSFILQAREMLELLSKRQDVYLEKAICDLLLGQPQAASEALQKSQERENLAFIRQHSQGSLDLLPGLCLYAEHWLTTEVFSQFKDLVNRQDSLKEYFANGQVQNYLEALSVSNSGIETKVKKGKHDKFINLNFGTNQKSKQVENNINRTSESLTNKSRLVNNPSQSSINSPTTERRKSISFTTSTEKNSRLGIARQPQQQSNFNNNLSAKNADFLINNKTDLTNNIKFKKISFKKKIVRFILIFLSWLEKNNFSSQKQKMILFLLLIIFLGFGIWRFNLARNNSNNALLEIQVKDPIVNIPNSADPDLSTKLLTSDTAKEVIERWLSIKAEVFGNKGRIERLQDILDTSLFPLWRDRARQLKNNNAYINYQHSVKISSVKTSDRERDRATVEAFVKEKAQKYQNGASVKEGSYDDKLLVRYQLIRKNNLWFVANIQVVK
jgi:hypothetical protein